MVTSEWAECPSCHFPCRIQAFKSLVAAQGQCPMCNQEVATAGMQVLKSPMQKLA